jgi:hypothetical protein
MNANEFGKKLGIGVRVAGRIARERAEAHARAQAAGQTLRTAEFQGAAESREPVQSPSQPARAVYESPPRTVPDVRAAVQKTHKLTRAAGRGIGGFLRPFGRVGGILWLEMTGFFFGLFALYFAVDLWRVRLSYAAGPQHTRFLIAAALTAVFGYLSGSAFWRARRK